jgi:predicted acetyltransferase
MTVPIEDTGTVLLTKAGPRDAAVIDNLLQLYTHDFSDYWAGTAQGNLNQDGRFEAYPLDEYWLRPNWSALLIWRNQVLAGFSLINDKTHSGEPAGRNMGEFFILRKHRGQGVGQLAAELIFSLHEGSWEVAVARKNLKAYKFWRKAICGAGRATDIREMDLNGEKWNGPVFRFIWH